MNAEGQMPAGIKIGKMLRWDSAVIAAWIADGCPVPKKKGAGQ
jgi:predicted DNA-binding transcriptional regulator AlpA